MTRILQWSTKMFQALLKFDANFAIVINGDMMKDNGDRSVVGGVRRRNETWVCSGISGHSKLSTNLAVTTISVVYSFGCLLPMASWPRGS